MISRETWTFRATWEAWFGQLLLPLIFFSTLSFTAVTHSELNPAVAWLGLSLLMMIVFGDYLLPMLRNWASIDAKSISGSINGEPFHMQWSEIVAAWHTRHKGRPYLCLGTREGTVVFPLRFMDQTRLIKIVRMMAPCQALEENALRKLPDYQAWVSERSLDFAMCEETRTVADYWLLQALGWGTNEIGPKTVCRITVFGRSSMDWSEVRGIEIDPLGLVMIFIGEHKHLTISGPAFWSGVGKLDAVLFLTALANANCIPMRRTVGALLRSVRARQSAG